MCWKPIVDDLKELEENGILYKGARLPVYPLFLFGDNLGSHQVGGFIEYFGGEYWCRYCDITSEEFHERPHIGNNLKTPEEYRQHGQEALDNNLTHFKGMKFDSIFNECEDYHVCGPGLPPCICHDFHEGCMPLILKYLIAKNYKVVHT